MQRRNDAWLDKFQLSDAEFRWDLATGELRFRRETDEIVSDLCLVGTTSDFEGTFLWSWANESIDANARRGIETVREFGLKHDLPLLTDCEWGGGRAEALEMVAIAGQLQDAEGTFVDKAGDVTLFFTLRNFRIVTINAV